MFSSHLFICAYTMIKVGKNQKVTYFYLSMEIDYLMFLKHYVHFIMDFLNDKIVFIKLI